MANSVNLGGVRIVNAGVKGMVELHVPAGMSGSKLISWKRKHADVLPSLGVSVPPVSASAPSESDSVQSDEGDRFMQP